ncbi:hypothetical protein ACFYZI_37495 [Streptomyces griseorubiginosus]|uniref:hypothetical protein n=1 Tax=Streptomyces griseorubiginosus TaxID=67304 RepID=UPI00369691E9
MSDSGQAGGAAPAGSGRDPARVAAARALVVWRGPSVSIRSSVRMLATESSTAAASAAIRTTRARSPVPSAPSREGGRGPLRPPAQADRTG